MILYREFCGFGIYLRSFIGTNLHAETLSLPCNFTVILRRRRFFLNSKLFSISVESPLPIQAWKFKLIILESSLQPGQLKFLGFLGSNVFDKVD